METVEELKAQVARLTDLLENSLDCVGWIDQRGLFYKGLAPPEDKNCIWRPVYTRRKYEKQSDN